MLRQRILTAVIGLPVLFAIIWFGNPWLTLIIAVIAILGSLEFHRMTVSDTMKPISYFAIAIAVLLTISPYYPDFITKPIILTLAIIISLIWLLFLPKKDGAFHNWAWLIAGIIYLGWMTGYWAELRNLVNGREWMYWSMITIMASDTTAFFVGRAWGRHHMAPTISPKKTWEGAIGGAMGSIIVATILGAVFSLPLSYWQLVLAGCFISIIAQLGDLVESLLKRNTGVKDSGKLVPGHGGILDRIDSFIFTGALVYYLALAVS